MDGVEKDEMQMVEDFDWLLIPNFVFAGSQLNFRVGDFNGQKRPLGFLFGKNNSN